MFNHLNENEQDLLNYIAGHNKNNVLVTMSAVSNDRKQLMTLTSLKVKGLVEYNRPNAYDYVDLRVTYHLGPKQPKKGFQILSMRGIASPVFFEKHHAVKFIYTLPSHKEYLELVDLSTNTTTTLEDIVG